MRRRAPLLLAAILGLVAAGLLGGRHGDDAVDVPPPGLSVAVMAAEAVDAFEREQRFVGRVEFAQEADPSFELGGQIVQVLVDEGAAVAAGEPIAQLDTARLRARRAELVAARAEARARLELASLRDARARTLLAEEVISSQRADDTRLDRRALEAALARVDAAIHRVEVDLDKATLVAPFAGRVSARHVDAGEVVRAGQAVVHLLETGRPEVRVGVPRAVAVQISERTRVPLEIAGSRVDATVLAVLPERRDATRTVPVRLALGGAPRVNAGDLAIFVWRERVAAAGFWLPRSALAEGTRGSWAVYVVAPGPDGARGDVERRPVEIVHEEGARVLVRGALRERERVVPRGVHRLVPGQEVALVPDPEAHARRAADSAR